MTNAPSALVPAPPAGHLARPSADRQWRKLLEQDIGIDGVEEALEFATLDEPDDPNVVPSKFRVMLSRMRDPALGLSRDRKGNFKNVITKVMKDAGINKIEMMVILEKRDRALAMLNSSRHIYDILDDMGEDARSRVVDCQKCGGEGELPDDEVAVGDPDLGEPALFRTKSCGQCGGAGKVRKIGDAESRKILMRIHGLDQSKGGVTVNQNTQVAVKVDAGKPESKQSDITTRVQRYLDADVVGTSK